MLALINTCLFFDNFEDLIPSVTDLEIGIKALFSLANIVNLVGGAMMALISILNLKQKKMSNSHILSTNPIQLSCERRHSQF